ncbi:tigger transposable element-derived protein 6-like [Bufo gargarizans]|uniref:tigger transposable element-derived protein 6-like n=1 Tax=Bufo gargarizans TaxID=30331 RepID=UPI001CF36B0F|nr:tigger transposable element-derived protein 6-like [Bufo gargarizans]
MATSGTKRKLCILTLRDRISVIKESEAGRSQRDLAKEFNCSKTQIQATLANREHYLRQWQENVNENSKRRRWQPYEDVNKALLDWLYHARSEHFPISGPMLQEKALQIASQLGLHRFHASNGWLNKFRTRHNIVFHPIAGATIEMREEDGAVSKDQLHVIAAGYADSDIYNMDETGLFFKAIPDKTLTVRSAQCQGGNWAEQRLTVALCANLCGDKEPPLVIHTGTGHPHSTEALGIWRHTNRKAWMTPEIYRSWLEKLNERMRLQDRRILLFVDGAPCHCAEKLSHVEVTLLPTNGTPWSSPMCQGAIRAFKIHYRKKLLRSLLARMDDARPVHVLAEGITMVDALSWVKMAWGEVKPETITRGFLQSGFVPTVDVSHDDDEDLARSLAILNQLGKAVDVSIDLENIDENVDCFSREEEEDPHSDPPASDLEAPLPAEPMALEDALSSIRRHRALAAGLGSPLLMDSLLRVEAEYENIIVAKKFNHP